jgi:hypothetical protein
LPVDPAQTEPAPLMVQAGSVETVTVVVAAIEVHPLTVRVTVYVPPTFVVTLEIDGFCAVDVKLFGPLQP